MDVVLGPDVFVNASVALGSPPEQVVRRLLGDGKRAPTSTWVVSRIEGILRSIPSFREEAVEPQMDMIDKLTKLIDETEHGPDEWRDALVALAKAAGVERVVTDHPDLAEHDPVDGVEFISTEGWLLEETTPPPPPSA